MPSGREQRARTAWLLRDAADLPVGDLGWLAAGEAATAADLHLHKRRAEFLLGRWAAKHALAAALGTPVGSDVEVVADPHGAPRALLRGRPLPVTIAITHREGLAAIVVDPAARPVGCDLEWIEPRSAAFVADYLTAAEQGYVEAATDRALAANLLWSAKESVTKVLHEGLRHAMPDVEVTVTDTARGPWWRWDGRLVADGRRFAGWWRRVGDGHLLTVAYDGERPPPEPLEPEPTLDPSSTDG